MNIPKELIVERVRASGDFEKTARAEGELPEKIDPERDGELLRRYDLDPSELIEEFRGQSPEVG